ncbi:MAG: hypothetical protein NT056_07135 [Proteobacteria bacterium]|nr:hypothetical protein [Pseudomonadota bacterium]
MNLSNFIQRGSFISAGLALGLAAFACGGGKNPAGPAQITIPSYPFEPNEVLVVDAAQIADVASAYCRGQGQSAAGEDFWLGYLPLEAIDDLGAEEITPEAARARLGSLYLSGFFGGVWLRDNYFFPGGATQTSTPADFPGEEMIFGILARSGAGLLAAAEDGDREEVFATARAILPFFLILYGYNQGYYETLSAYPPAGYTPAEEGLKCRGFLDCEDSTVELSVLDRYRPAREKLDNPDTPDWEELSRLARKWGEEATQVGGGVWESFLSGSGMEPGTYRRVERLSSGYLLVAEAAVFAVATGLAEKDPVRARAGIRLAAGLLVWSGSYFYGLLSGGAYAESFPGLNCPGS